MEPAPQPDAPLISKALNASNPDGGNFSAETVELDKSGNADYEAQFRGMPQSPARSPAFNRMKYYSALRTGFQHLNPVEKDTFLKVPKHVIEPLLYYIHAPF